MSKLHALRILLREKSFRGDTDHWTLMGKNASNVYLDPRQSKKEKKRRNEKQCRVHRVCQKDTDCNHLSPEPPSLADPLSQSQVFAER